MRNTNLRLRSVKSTESQMFADEFFISFVADGIFRVLCLLDVWKFMIVLRINLRHEISLLVFVIQLNLEFLV